MQKTIDKNAPVQGDMFQRLRDLREVTSVEMASRVELMNKFPGGEGKTHFSAVEVALVLFGTSDSKRVYELFEAGEIGGADLGTGTQKRNLSVSRESLYAYLRSHCCDRQATVKRR